jgi:hypothetical protein
MTVNLRRSLEPGRGPALDSSDPGPQFHGLWFALQRWKWASLVVVPADEGASSVRIAQSLATVGGRIHGAAVTAFVAESLDFDSAAEIATTLAASTSSSSPRGGSRDGQVIVAVEPLVSRPLAIGIARSADIALLCIEKGRTRIDSAQRTIELVGRDRVVGCLMLT